MLHLSSYHSNGLPTVVWSNKVNLIGEKVYKPKIHFCEYCNKPILIYGRLIPCKHVFCFTCAALCSIQLEQNNNIGLNVVGPAPPIPGPSEPPQTSSNQSPSLHYHSPQNNNSNSSNSNNNMNYNNTSINHPNDKHYQRHPRRSSNNNGNNSNTNSKNSDSNQSFSHNRDNNNVCLMSIDESTSNTSTTIHHEITNSPHNVNGDGIQQQHQQTNQSHKGCHRCGVRALRVERNTLNTMFVCHLNTCRRAYLSARDLQAHVTHRHSRSKGNNCAATSSASMAAIASAPYISSSTLMHLNSQNQTSSQRQSSSSTSTTNNSNNNNNNNKHKNNSPNNHHYHHRRERDSRDHLSGGGGRDGAGGSGRDRERDRDRDRMRERDRYNKDREIYQRDRQDSKEYQKQCLQRAAQWAEASAQMLGKGLNR